MTRTTNVITLVSAAVFGATIAVIATTFGSGAPWIVPVGDRANGASVDVRVGQILSVTLDSVYWNVVASAQSTAMQVDGRPIYKPGRGFCSNTPGGCGSVTARYRPVAPGTTVITAHRVTCGEAMLCPPAQRNWHINVRILPRGTLAPSPAP